LNQKPPEIVAAVDLGSNSFHMLVCSLKDGQLQTIDRLKEMVRLASGLDNKNFLDDKTQQRALACLEKFGQRLRNFPPGSVRVVGTNTLRTAKNASIFLHKAEIALGQTIDIISGIEEARLIYQGVAHSLESNAKKRFVMDIGGGSTEYIIGKNDQPMRKRSLRMGCVSISNEFFGNGKISEKKFKQAVLYAEQQLEHIALTYHHQHWDEAIGASGSLRSIDKIITANGWSNKGITQEGLQRLVKHTLQQKHVDELNLPELDPERAPVFPGGLAIIFATFKSLKIDQMKVSDGALREGLIYDLVGRIYNHDIRSETVQLLAERYHIDQAHAARIKHTLYNLFSQLEDICKEERKAALDFLDWAAQLHEIGHDIAHSQYHKHSAYILENADMAGFSQQDQIILSTIVRLHRRKFAVKLIKKLPEPWNHHATYLAILLRLAILLHRNRHDTELPVMNIAVNQEQITIQFPSGWLDKSPLTNADLILEADYLKSAGFKLSFS
jgi:exopolyphosphatase / guanosine-5'-triphosphate,3'-diphosphate pyrophosphatase